MRYMVLVLVAATLQPRIAADGSEVAGDASPMGWEMYAPRAEIRPDFSFERVAGGLALSISGSGREAVDGAWVRTYPVRGGSHWRFSALKKTADITSSRRSALAKITWHNDQGKLVPRDGDLARPEYPTDRQTRDGGWTEVSDIYLVPEEATRARVELHLRWTKGSVCWTNVSLSPARENPGRLVRLAAVHFRPHAGQTLAEKCAQFAPLIAEASRQRADLVCLPESLTYYGSGRSLVEVAEPIPGPSTATFARLAKRHNLYIVAGLTERSASVVYNTAVLLGPDGNLVGKYRKVCLPREEIEAGVTPGSDYPVFDTRFGKVGLMICWDAQFPEVARHLSNKGAEVVAMPIWGGNPTLASARAIENQIHLVTSTYTDPDESWMKSGVWDHTGELLVEGRQWGTVVVAEVDLDQRKQWEWLGDFKARIARERPAGGFQQ